MISYIERKIELRRLIEQVSVKFGGDEVNFLELYISEIIEQNKYDIDKAIECFKLLLRDR